jgi:hypothetical protein
MVGVYAFGSRASVNVLFDHKLTKRVVSGPALKIINNNSNAKLYSAIKVIHYILKNISENRANEMKNEINLLFNMRNGLKIKYLISNTIGREM